MEARNDPPVIPEAEAQLGELAERGIDYNQVTRQLQDEGVIKFKNSFDTLLECIGRKRKVLQPATAA